MNTALAAVIVFGWLIGAVLLGRALRRLLSRRAFVRGLQGRRETGHGSRSDYVGTGLGVTGELSKGLVRHRKKRGNPDGCQGRVSSTGCWPLTDRKPLMPGSGFAAQSRQRFSKCGPEKRNVPARLAPDTQAGNAVYGVIQGLSPHNDTQGSLKAQAATLATDLGQVSVAPGSAVSPPLSRRPMLIILVSWLAIIFLGFSVLAPTQCYPPSSL